ncbi:hypothetical protein STCU_09339 [Strigomonas culicis]|uniref:Exocyst complex component EXOC6/Sec15 N-terminal domain-containing protein n=1 Tax=Strigomonas culicis TaxID=28005 RepID=S9V9P1_9TRYP|nr:hypothetical protein STCU_09339 [Strigomonas culicis]|eukprot:EPY19680.1 hypothetical protein STCU_09339 [Strigomonas culicis]
MDEAFQRKVYKILRSNCDAPRVLFVTEFPLVIERHDTHKRVYVVSTRLFTYLIKEKGFKLYARWANRYLLVSLEQQKIAIHADVQSSDTAGDATSSIETGQEEFRDVVLTAGSVLEASAIERALSLLVRNAQRAAEQLAAEEGEDPDAVAGGDADAADSPPASDHSDDEGAGDSTLPRPGKAAAGRADAGVGLAMAPSRYIAITSLVDGEFADYTTLRTAYMKREEEALLKDLDAFVKDNEGQVEALCQNHYTVFIHAAQQCLAISEKDAQFVGEELSGATALVRSAVVDMRQVAANLILCRSTRDNLMKARGLLARCMAVAEYLETAESQLKREQLIGAITSLQELVRLSAPLAEYAIGEYVLHVRVPALTTSVFHIAVVKLNAWLKLLRDSANLIGKATLAWRGCIAAGQTTKKVVVAEGGNYWWLVEHFASASITFADFDQGALIASISNGAGIQRVFTELRRDEYFVKYYVEGRAQQAKADLFHCPLALDGVSSADVAADFESFCATALGFMLIEDIVYSATYPHVQSSAEVLRTWDRITQVITDRSMRISHALLPDPNYTASVVRLFATLRSLTQHAAENCKSVELSPVALSHVAETLSDTLVSLWLQSACVECTQLVLMDALDPSIVNSPAEFESYVSRFYLNKCPLLELPVPPRYTAGALTLPYSIMVPLIGEKAAELLTRCYSIISMDHVAVVRQSEMNNVDEMLLKYISVLFRTVSETLQGQLMSISSRSILQFSVFISSCSTMPVIVSCIEQQFMLRWQGSYSGGERQTMGTPKLLSASAAPFARCVQKGIEALMQACVEELTERLRPAATLNFWRRHIDCRTGKRKSDGDDGVGDCMQFFLGLIPKMKMILQSAVVRSIMGTVITHIGQGMQTAVEGAVKSAYAEGERDFALLRDVVKEFAQQCATLVPVWQRRLTDMLPDITAAQRFPMQINMVVDDLNAWLAPREAQYQHEKANQPQLMAGIEGATKAVTKGFQAVGKTVTATANVFKK